MTSWLTGASHSYSLSPFLSLAGAGKTTLATKLAEKMNLPVFYEPVIDNVYLDDFYKDPARYGFPLQVGSSVWDYVGRLICMTF